MHARTAITTVFFLDGFAIASWAPHIPTVQADLGLGAAALGLALLGLPIGALVAQPLAGWLAVRVGSRPVVLAGVIALSVALPLPGVAGSQLALAGALMLVGATLGAVDVSMNVQGSSQEWLLRRPILASLHAAYGFGALAGAANGTLAAAAGVDPALHLLVTGLACAAIGAAVSPRLLPAAADAVPEGQAFARPDRALLALGAVGFCVALVEGATLDWSAVYLRTSLDAGPGLAGVAFVAFSGSWAVTRLFADGLRARWGSPALLRWGALVAAAGFGAGLLGDSAGAAIAGFAVLGAGIAAGFPVVIAAAGRAPGRTAGSAIAAVSTTAYAGFLAGPPLMGLVAEASSLPTALALLLLPSTLAVALLAASTRWADAPGPAAPAAVTMRG